jgi:hypothetical protein
MANRIPAIGFGKLERGGELAAAHSQAQAGGFDFLRCIGLAFGWTGNRLNEYRTAGDRGKRIAGTGI